MQKGSCRDVHLCTDSLAATTALQSLTVKSKRTLECLITVNTLAEAGILLELLWNKRIRGNEIAGDLSRSEAKQLIVGLEPSVGISC